MILKKNILLFILSFAAVLSNAQQATHKNPSRKPNTGPFTGPFKKDYPRLNLIFFSKT